MRRKLFYFIPIMFSLFIILFSSTSCDNNSNGNNSISNNTTDVHEDLCVVSFDTNGGNDIESQYVKKGEKIKEPSNPVREGYEFNGWYVQNEKWSFIGYTVTENITLEAKWTINQYTLSLTRNDNNGGYVRNNSGLYDFGSSITIEASTNPGYTFNGWYEGEQLIHQESKYSFNMPAKNVEYMAKWTANTNTPYKVEHYLQSLTDFEYSATPYEVDDLKGVTNTLTNALAKTYTGFISPNVTQQYIRGNGDTIVKLFYARENYVIKLSQNIKDAGVLSIISSGYPYEYRFGQQITLKSSLNAGYLFSGWYNGNTQISDNQSYSFTINDDVELEARYTVNKYKITINNEATGVIIDGVINNNEYDFNSEIKLTASNIPNGYSINWVRSDSINYLGDEYSFSVPANDLEIKVELIFVGSKNDNKIYFGTYPQTLITDDSIVNELNDSFGKLPTSTKLNGWIYYNYYVNEKRIDYMYYKDIDYDKNGTYDYRGVFFTNNITSCQTTNGYLINKVYWFSYDIIEWDVLKEDNGKCLIIANLILDCQDYYPSSSGSVFQHNGGSGYANNYELSNIRKWLNESFYITAFNSLQKELIEITTVDNSPKSTSSSSNNYYCNDTSDNLFLLSYKEVSKLYSSNEARMAVGSDYAKCQGLYVSDEETYFGNSEWMLRSPFYTGAGNAKAGTIENSVSRSGNMVMCYYAVSSHIGIRPACWIKL